jgi:hypothetical protein
MARRGIMLLALAATAVLCAASSAGASVTIGSNLTTPATLNTNCNGATCTTANLTLNASNQAPGGLTSPVNGVVTTWRASAGGSATDLSLRVLRPVAGLTYTGAGTSAPASITFVSSAIATSLPIQLGDAIGLENRNSNNVLGANPGATQIYWRLPSLADGATLQGSSQNGIETLVQATIEPTSAFTVRAPVLNKKKGTATLTVRVPNPGTLDFMSKRAKLATAPTKTVAAAGPVKFLVSATGKKLKKLKKNGKVNVSATFTFTPNFGVANTQSTRVTLKKKK